MLPKFAWICLFTTLPMVWGNVPFGPLQVRPYMVGGMLFVVLMLLGRGFDLERALRNRGLLVYLTLTFVTMLSFVFHDTTDGLRIPLAYGAFGVVAFVAAGSIIRPYQIIGYARLSAISCVLYVTLSAASMGMFLPLELVSMIVDYNYLSTMREFYGPIFSAFGGISGREVLTPVRNQFSPVLLFTIGLIVFNMQLRLQEGAQQEARAYRFLDVALIAFLSLLVLTMFARSSLLVIFISSLLVIYAYAKRKRAALMATSALLLTGIMSLYLVLVMPSEGGGLLYERLFEDTKSYDARLDQYREAFSAFSSSPLLGIGYFTSAQGHVPHNFLVANMVFTGFVGLVLSVSTLTLYALQAKSALLSKNSALVVVFVIFGVKSMVSGNGGYPDYVAIVGASIVTSFLLLRVPSDRRAGRASRKRRPATTYGLRQARVQ